MKKILFLNMAICLVALSGFSQNAESGLRINHNQNGTVRGNAENTHGINQSQSEVQALLQETYEKDAVYVSRMPEDELLEKRDRTSKHFINPDGSVEAFLSIGSINYKENGKWQTIERAILPNNSGKFSEFAFSNTKNAFKSFYSNTPANGIKTIVENQEITEWQNKKIEFYDADMNLIGSINAENSEISINHANATYANIFPYTEAQITQLHDGRKIDYEITSQEFVNLIPENTKYLSVSEDITLPAGWTATYYVDKLSENKEESKQRISIFNDKKEEILQYQPPVYFEKENRQGMEDPIGEYQISQNGQVLSIKTITEADWFLDANRQFPVVIDPTVSVYPNNTVNWSRSVASNGFDYTDCYFGHDGVGFVGSSVKFNISSIPIGSTVNSAVGYINIVAVSQPSDPNGYPWQFSNSADPTTTSGLTLYNSMNVGYSNISTVASYGWNNSSFFNPLGNQLIENAITNGFVNIGIVPAGNYWLSSYALINNHTSSNRPYISITYTLSGLPPTCTTPIMPTDGFSGHSPADPLTWNAASGATSYDVYFGTSSNPPFVTNTSGTTYSPALTDNTTYYWKIVPKNAYGEPTGCAVWEFTTGAAPANGDYRTRYLTGIYGWNNPDNWEVFNGSSWNVATILPGSTNNVLIQSGSQYVVLNNPMTASGTPATCKNLRIEGTLQFWNGLDASNDAYGDLDIYGNLDIMPSGILEAFMNVTLIEAVSAINMVNGGDITNYGELMLYDEFDGASYTHAWITFYGSAESNLTLASGSSTRLFYIQMAKDNPTDIVNFNINEDFLAVNDEYSGNNGFLKSYNVNSWDESPTGHLKISGSYAKNNPVWFMGLTTNSLLFNTSNGIASNLTVEIDNPDFGVMAQNVTFNLAGKLIVNQGQCDIGATSGNVSGVDQSQYYLNILDGGQLEINGGALNTRAGIAGNGTNYFTLTDGFVNVGRNANASNRGLFDLQGNPQVNISGGKITMTDYRFTTNNLGYRVDDGNINITGGTLQIGTSLTPPLTSGEAFSIQGHAPSIELYTDGVNISNNAIMWDDVQCYGDIDIPELCGLSIYDQDNGDVPHTFSITGDINHEGNLWAEVENSKLLLNGTTNQTFHTTGAYSDVLGEAGISILEVDNSAGVQLTGSSTAVTKNFINTNGTFHIGDCSLGLSGIVTRTNGCLGGNTNSELYITGNGTLGNLYFDPLADNLKLLEVDRQNIGIVNMATDLNVHQAINFTNGIVYTYLDGNVNNESDTIYLASDAELINENNNSYLYGAVSISNATYPQTLLTGPETFDSDILVHGFTAPNNVWFAPDSNDPIVHEASGGCPGGRIGFAGSWNNFWGNFVRLPETDCSGYDAITLSFDVSHSYFASQPNDWIRFYMWADGGYEHNVVSVKIDGVDVTYDSGINGKGFQYTESRSCANVEVTFDISAIANKTNILLYLEASCGYDNGNEFYTYFDNISVSGVQTGTVSPDFGNVWAIMNNLNEDLGDITVTRITGADGQMTIPDATSIDCHWDIQIENQPTTPVNMSFKWLDLFDNGLSTTEMLIYTFHEPNPWEDIGSPVSVSGNPRTISADANQFSKWTVAKKDEVLPVSLLYFDVQCNGHSKEFSWATASEINSDYFLIMESLDNENFKPIAKIEAAGQSYQTKEYRYAAEELSDDAYYRLKQVDFDGSSENFSMIYHSCEQDNKHEISVYPNPFDGTELNLFSSEYIGESQIKIYDTSGRIIREMQYNLTEGNNTIRFGNALAPGAYLLEIQDKTNQYKPLQIIVR
jgi:hypothetical protein